MKKLLSLLIASLFVLPGCAKEISPEDAEVVAQDIKTHEINPNSISEIKLKEKVSVHISGTKNRELTDYKYTESRTYELSSKFNYIHIVSSHSQKDKVENEDSNSEREEWVYMKNKMLFKATKIKSKGSEQKYYSKIEKYSEAIKEFSKVFDSNVSTVCNEARGTNFLDTSIFDKYVDEEYQDSFSYVAKFYSSGDGNFRVIGAAKVEDNEQEDIKTKGVGTLSCNWNKYLLKKASLALTMTTSDGTNKNDLKYDLALSEKVSSIVIPKYPNISSFAQK